MTTLLELLVQHPLWPHHAAALVAPLVLVSGAAAIPLTARPIGSAAAAAASAVVLLAVSIASAAYVRT